MAYLLSSEYIHVVLTIVRAFGRGEQFKIQNDVAIDQNCALFFAFTMSSRWLAIRLDFVATLVVLVISLFSVALYEMGGHIDAAAIGLSLIYALQLTSMLQWTVSCNVA